MSLLDEVMKRGPQPDPKPIQPKLWYDKNTQARFNESVKFSWKDFSNPIWPFLASVLASVLVALIALTLHYMNFSIGSRSLEALSVFILSNLVYLFVLFLAIAYARYVYVKYPMSAQFVWPIINAILITGGCWIVATLFLALGSGTQNAVPYAFASFVLSNLAAIFLLMLLAGYFFATMRYIFSHQHGS